MTRDFAGSSLYHIHFSIRAWTWNFFEGLNSFSERFFNIICFARVLSSDSCCRFFDIINWINLRAYYLFCSLNTRMFSFFFFFVEFVLISRRSSLSNSAESGTSKFLRKFTTRFTISSPQNEWIIADKSIDRWISMGKIYWRENTAIESFRWLLILI